MGTIPTIGTFTAGQILTAAEVNEIKAAFDFWSNVPKCSVYASTALTTTTSTWATIGCNAELYDVVQSGDSPSHDTVTNNQRIVCRTAGKYEITGQVAFVSNSTGFRMARVLLNGVTGSPLVESHQDATSGVSTSVPLPTIEYPLVVGDYIQIEGYQNSGGNLDTLPGIANTFFRMKLSGT